MLPMLLVPALLVRVLLAPVLLLSVLLPDSAVAGSLPLGTMVAGTVSDATISVVQTGGSYATCGVNIGLAGGQVIDYGPSLGYWQQNIAGGPVVLSFPSLGRALTNAQGQTAWSYYSAGTGVLKFTGAGSGVVLFPSPANWVSGTGLSVSFTGFATTYNVSAATLQVQMTLKLGDCTLPFNAIYQS